MLARSIVHFTQLYPRRFILTPLRRAAYSDKSQQNHSKRSDEVITTNQQQQQRTNQAAEQFANAIKDSYHTVADRGVSAQEVNTQLTQDFFNRSIENLRTQAEDTRQMTQQLVDQQQRAAEAGQTLTQESVDAYLDFVDSLFSFYQGSAQKAKWQTQR